MTYIERIKAMNKQTQAALETVYTALNQGQRQKLIKNDKVKALLVKFAVVPADTEVEQ